MTTLPGQEQEAPRYNHPCGDLLDSEKRVDYINRCVPLYKASVRGDLEAARVILNNHPNLVRCSITHQKETPLHVAALVQNHKFVKYLVDMMSEDELELQNEEGNNAFCVAAIAGNRRMAMIMLQKNRQLLTIRGSGNMMPLYLAAVFKQHDMITYLYDHSQQMSSDGWTDDDRNGVFLKCIECDYFDGALRMLNDREDILQDKYVSNVLHLLAQKAYVFHLNPYIERFDFYSELVVKRVVTRKIGTHLRLTGKEREAATTLLKTIWEKVVVKSKDEIDIILRGPPVIKDGEKDTYHPSPILFVAAKNGNTNFLKVLFDKDPDLIRKTNDDGQTIFHVGLSYHHHSFLNLLSEIRPLKDTIAQVKDKDGNTLLHSIARKRHEGKVRGATAQLHVQDFWFKQVRAILPPSYVQLKNAAGQTPIDVFNHIQKDLSSQAEKWIKETSNQCMVVAALITTISFAAAFTIPGGYNQDTGFPMFLRNTPFTLFVILDSISFILSSLSILIFLPISIYHYPGHSKFVLGFQVLFCSIISLMAAFSASFFVLYHNKLPIIMSSLATLPIFVYYLMYVRASVCPDFL